MNIRKIIISIIVILIIINIICLPKSFATTASDIFDNGDDFLSSGDNPDVVIDETNLKTTSSTVYKILLTIGICVAVIVGAVLGLQFILGSVEGKAKISEALVPYIVGCFIVFGAFTIWGIVIKMGETIAPDTGYTHNGSSIHTSSSGDEHGGGGGRI